MTRMLASVRTLDEALLALRSGADLIDLKEPTRGALGALDHAAVRICVQAIGGQAPVSATIGDIPSMDPAQVVAAVNLMADTGVDYIKVGFFSRPQAFNSARALAARTRETQLVAVLFADEAFDPALVDVLASAGFAGAMLDTALKTGRSLRQWRRDDEIGAFVDRCRGAGLLVGVAGSLAREDIPPLLQIDPDYLGFRGALCRNGERRQQLDASAFMLIREAIPETAPRRRPGVAA